jgi:predicted secreted hydrolase
MKVTTTSAKNAKCGEKSLLLFALVASFVVTSPAADWRLALLGWRYEFPRDHAPHREFKTEWWYFTGTLRGSDGRRFGYQITFFRQGVRPPDAPDKPTSRFVIDDLKFAHFALSDISSGHFYFHQKIGRGAFGEAGFGTEQLAWIDDWRLQLKAGGSFAVEANAPEVALTLDLATAKPWVIHGEHGISQKAAGEGHASHYYSGTRLKTSGSLTIHGRSFAVTGESWFDHEWATNQLTPGQIGWNWFSVQLDDGTELMLYQMRTRDGGVDPASSGTFIARDGQTRHLRRDDYQLTPREFWTSKETGGRYPIAWDVAVPSLGLKLRVTTPLRGQELVLRQIAYWEGAIDLEGSREGQPVGGHGYLELTGYAGELEGLSERR